MDDNLEVQDVMQDLTLQTLASLVGKKRNGASPAQQKYLHGFHFKEYEDDEIVS